MFRSIPTLTRTAHSRKYRNPHRNILNMRDSRIYETRALERKYPHYKTRTWSPMYQCTDFFTDPNDRPYAHVQVSITHYNGFHDAPWVHDFSRVLSAALPGIDVILDSSPVAAQSNQNPVTPPTIRRMTDGRAIPWDGFLAFKCDRSLASVKQLIDDIKQEAP